MIILETKNLTKHFDGVQAVDNFSIGIEQGRITSIIGPNGSGKTTLINVLSGMLALDNGFVVLSESVKLYKIRPFEISTYGITRTFQEVRLFNQMTVLDNILVVLTERNVFGALFEKHKAYHLDKAADILKLLNLWEKRDELAINLSYGQRKLLEISRALAMEADPIADASHRYGARIFLLDEPFAGLFPEMRKIVSGIIQELKQKGKTVILIEHSMDLIRQLSDYVFVMDEGKLLAQGKPDEVLAKKEVIEAYLGE